WRLHLSFPWRETQKSLARMHCYDWPPLLMPAASERGLERHWRLCCPKWRACSCTCWRRSLGCDVKIHLMTFTQKARSVSTLSPGADSRRTLTSVAATRADHGTCKVTWVVFSSRP
ncbi:Uncharacterized protein DAT39_023425, partial [Clarias magur]